MKKLVVVNWNLVLQILFLALLVASCKIPDYQDFTGNNSHGEFELPTPYSSTSTVTDYTIPITLNGYTASSSAFVFNSYEGSTSNIIEGYYIPSALGGSEIVVVPFMLKSDSLPVSDIRLTSIKFSATDTEYTYPDGVYLSNASKVVKETTDTLLNKKNIDFAYPYGSVLYANGGYLNCGVGPGESCFFVINLSSTGGTKIKASFTNPIFTQDNFDANKLTNNKYVATTLSCAMSLTTGSKTYAQPQAVLLPTSIAAPSATSLSFTITNSGTADAQIRYEYEKSNNSYGFNAIFLFAKEGEKTIPRYVRFLQLTDSSFDGSTKPGFIEIKKSITLTVLDMPNTSVEATHVHLYLDFVDVNPSLK